MGGAALDFQADTVRLHLMVDGEQEQVFPLNLDPATGLFATPADFWLDVAPGQQVDAWIEASKGGEPIDVRGDFRMNKRVGSREWWIQPADYDVSSELQITSRTPDVVHPQRRVLDSQYLSGFVDSPDGQSPRKAGDHLYWYPGMEMTGIDSVTLTPQEITTDYGVTHMLAGTVRALDGDGNPLPGGLVRIAFIRPQGGAN